MTLCTKFQPNVFNKTKCQNCFKPKELHSARALECCHTARCITRCGFMFVAPEQYDFNNPSDKSRRWQRRFVVLYDDGELRYSVDDNVSTIPQGTIDMTQCLDIEQDAEPITSHKLSMSITLKDKTTYIRAGNKDERNRWYEVLSVYVKPKRINGRVYGTAAIPSNIYASANSNKSEPTIVSNTTWKDRSLSPPPHESNNKTNETDEYKISKSSESLRSNLANDSSGIAKTGWLVIMSGNNKEGDKRWFLLQANKLHYHIDSDSSSKKMGMFDLKLAYNVVESNISRNYGFKVETQHGDILLSAMTSQIRTSWMTALRSQIPRRSSNASSTTSSYTSAWPYTPKILADSEEMIYNVEEMMERRAKNRGLRSKSLVYPPSSGAAAAASSRKDRDRRLTEINAASATSAATNPSSANPASTNPAISSATAATAQLPTSRTEPPPLISDYRTSANKTANMQTDSDLIKNLQAEVQNLKQRIDKSCLCNNKNCEQDIVKLKNDANSNRDDEIKKIKDIYEDELRLAACEHQRQLADSDQLHVQQLEDQRVLLEEESLAAQDAISALKQQHRVEISHFNDIVNDLQTIDVDCVHQKLQEENLALQEELTKAENHLINRDNECMALKERIGQQLSDLHASRKRVQDLIQRNDQLNDKLSDDIASLMIMVDDKRSVQVTGTIEDITLELKLKEEQIWQLNEDLVSRSSELQDTTKELETTIEMFHELHKQHNDMQDNLNLEIQQLRVQLYLRPPSTDDDLSEDEIDNRSHSLTSNLSPVGRKQLWRMDREESDRGKNQTSNE